MTRPIEAGTVIAGTLRSEDLLEAFAGELETLVERDEKMHALSLHCGDWTDFVLHHFAHKRLIFDARSAQDESAASEIINELQDALNEYAPEGMYFGTLEGDGADFGWWYVEEESEVTA
jgi:hypothetical protein